MHELDSRVTGFRKIVPVAEDSGTPVLSGLGFLESLDIRPKSRSVDVRKKIALTLKDSSNFQIYRRILGIFGRRSWTEESRCSVKIALILEDSGFWNFQIRT